MPPRIPTADDFAPLTTSLPHALHFPDPPESTTAILVLFHGLGDQELPFAGFARSLNLPGVLGISVRGTAPLPASLVGGAEAGHYHWGDDLVLDPATGDIDVDSGFARARAAVMDKLVRGVLIDKCGWELGDILLFGYGQGGSLALGLASSLRSAPQVLDVSDTPDGQAAASVNDDSSAFKGIVSISGPLPQSMVPTVSTRAKSRTPVLVCQLSADDIEAAQREFDDVRTVRWGRGEVTMPRDHDEVLPLMKFFAERLSTGL